MIFLFIIIFNLFIIINISIVSSRQKGQGSRGQELLRPPVQEGPGKEAAVGGAGLDASQIPGADDQKVQGADRVVGVG